MIPAAYGPLRANQARRFSAWIRLPLVPSDQDLVIDQGVDNWQIWVYRATVLCLNILANAPLRAEAVAAVELWQPNLASLVDGDGSARITQTQVEAFESFLMNLSAVSTPGPR